MGQKFAQLETKQIEFIQKQHLFFVGTAGAGGRVNVSPKGMDTLRVIDTHKVVWLNLTGSGNESAAHVAENGRMTLMFCSFERAPLILRLYGQAQVLHPRDAQWGHYVTLFPPYAGARQLFELTIDMVQTSCGFAVPFFEYSGERETLAAWADQKGEEGLAQYWQEKNQLSLDGQPTYIFPPTK